MHKSQIFFHLFLIHSKIIFFTSQFLRTLIFVVSLHPHSSSVNATITLDRLSRKFSVYDTQSVWRLFLLPKKNKMLSQRKSSKVGDVVSRDCAKYFLQPVFTHVDFKFTEFLFATGEISL